MIGKTYVRMRACLSSSFNAKIGDARIYGFESNIKYQANANLSLEFSASYNDSHLISNTFANPNLQVTPGELPRVLQPAYSVMNWRLGLNQAASRWLSELYITNLTNRTRSFTRTKVTPICAR
ncbi:MAG: hypothetical protein NVSMB10_11770 [Steroidobacteraceae bacterium]